MPQPAKHVVLQIVSCQISIFARLKSPGNSDLFICCYKLSNTIGYELPVLYCSLNCQNVDYVNPSRPHEAVCTARHPRELNEIKIQLGTISIGS